MSDFLKKRKILILKKGLQKLKAEFLEQLKEEERLNKLILENLEKVDI